MTPGAADTAAMRVDWGPIIDASRRGPVDGGPDDDRGRVTSA